MKNKYELRFGIGAELESRKIYGRAIVFDKESNDLGFIEVLKRGCITLETIDNSNIIFNYNHDRSKILARSNKGVGNMSITLSDEGVDFEFDAPHTTIGNDVLEDIRNGNLLKCSFAFTIPDEPDALVWEKRNGVFYRTVNKIDQLFDFCTCVDEAYSDTYIGTRQAELKEVEKRLAELEDEEDEEKTEEKEQDIDNELIKDESKEENNSEEVKEDEEKRDANSTDDEEEVKEDEEKFDEDSKDDEEEEDKLNKEQRNNIKTNFINKVMNKNVSLIELINKALDSNEKRFNVSLELRTMTFGDKSTDESNPDPYHTSDTTVVEEYQGLVEPLYNNQVFKNLGIHMMTGAPRGIVNIPVIGKGTVGFASEIAKAVESGNTTTNVTLSPKRICAYVDISRMMLLTDTLGVNDAIRRDLYNAIADAIQNALLDDVAASEVRPAGILNGMTSTGTITTFKGLTDLEADLEDVCFENVQYLVSNKAYSALRNLAKSTKTTELVLENGTIDGTPVTRTAAIAGKKILLGDFSNIAMSVWQDAEVVIDEVSQAANGVVRLVVNMYVDWKVVRPEAFKLAEIA